MKYAYETRLGSYQNKSALEVLEVLEVFFPTRPTAPTGENGDPGDIQSDRMDWLIIPVQAVLRRQWITGLLDSCQ